MIPYGHQSIDKSDIQAVLKALQSDYLTQGPAIYAFEQALAKYCGSKYAVVVANGTAALHAAYFAAGLEPGDEFITSPLTFVATTNAGLYLGAQPVFVDCDEEGNINPQLIEEKISVRTKLIVTIDYAGRPVDLRTLKKITKKHNLVLIEDACHALGASYQGKKIGNISDLTVFSFHPVKSITTGEGGAILTNNKAYYQKLCRFRTHGITKNPREFSQVSRGEWYHEMCDLGFNYRLTDMQAALGTSQLKRLDMFISKRKKIAMKYHSALKEYAEFITCPPTSDESSWHLYVIRLTGKLLRKRSEVFASLRAAGIGVQVHYIPVYLQPYYQGLGYQRGMCPKAEAFYESAISIPIYPDLKAEDQSFVIKKLKEIVLSLT